MHDNAEWFRRLPRMEKTKPCVVFLRHLCGLSLAEMAFCIVYLSMEVNTKCLVRKFSNKRKP